MTCTPPFADSGTGSLLLTNSGVSFPGRAHTSRSPPIGILLAKEHIFFVFIIRATDRGVAETVVTAWNISEL